MEHKSPLLPLADRINNFDYLYLFSPDEGQRGHWSLEEQDIRQALNLRGPAELISIYYALSDVAKSEVFGQWICNAAFPKRERERHLMPSLSELMRDAWELFDAQLFLSFSDALVASWNRFKLVRQLTDGIAYFTYRKINGELRGAIGTLREGNFRPAPASVESPLENKRIVRYWDIEKRGWRSLRVDLLKSIYTA